MSVAITLMSFSAVWRARFDFLLVLLAFWVATISSSGGAIGLALGRKSSPVSVGGNLEGLGPSVLPVVPFSFFYLWLRPDLGAYLAPSGWRTLLWVAIWSQVCLAWRCGNLDQILGETEGLLGRYFGRSRGQRFVSVAEIYQGRCLPFPFMSICGECGWIVGCLPAHKTRIQKVSSPFG